MRSKLPLFLPAALAIAAIAAGCGDDDSSGSAATDGSVASSESDASSGSSDDGGSSDASSEPIATSSLTKAQYVKQANALCTRHREKRIKALNKYREENPEDSQKENFAGSLQAVYVPMIKLEIADLRELGAPKGDEKQIEAMIASFEKWVAEAEELDGGEPTKEFNKEVIRAGNLAGAYELIECTYG